MMRRRTSLATIWTAILLAGLMAAVAGCGGGSDPDPSAAESISEETSGLDCDELNSFATNYASAFGGDGSGFGSSPEDVDEILEAVSGLASDAPDDVRDDLETLSETMQELAEAASDIGLEPGEIPDEEQQAEILELVAELLDNPEYLDAATSFSGWMESAIGECMFDDTGTETETTESSDSIFGDETTESSDPYSGYETTTEASADLDEDVDEACDGMIALATLIKQSGETPSIGDIENIAALASEFAATAPAESGSADPFLAGEPRQSLEAFAESLESYARLLSELGLEPGDDAALDDPRVAEANDRGTEADENLGDWIEARCSAEDQAELEAVKNG
jgi:hypothetical protein